MYHEREWPPCRMSCVCLVAVDTMDVTIPQVCGNDCNPIRTGSIGIVLSGEFASSIFKSIEAAEDKYRRLQYSCSG